MEGTGDLADYLEEKGYGWVTEEASENNKK